MTSHDSIMIQQVTLDTPSGNTGSKCQTKRQIEVAVDYLSFVMEVVSRKQVVALMEYVTGTLPDEALIWRDDHPTFRGTTYHHSVSSVKGIHCQYSLPSDIGCATGRLRCEIPGNPLSEMDGRSRWRLCTGLVHSFPVRVTRCDVRVDFYDQREILEKAWEASLTGDFAGARKTKRYDGDEYVNRLRWELMTTDDNSVQDDDNIPREWIKAGSYCMDATTTVYTNVRSQRKSKGFTPHVCTKLCMDASTKVVTNVRKRVVSEYRGTGKTIYFGSPGSDKMTRIYDKEKESGGEYKCIRWETQFRDELAHKVFKNYGSITEWNDGEISSQFLYGVAIGAVRFVDRKSGNRLARQTNLPWYQELVDVVGTVIKVARSVKRLVIDEMVRWIDKAVAPTLATLKKIKGTARFYGWLKEVLELGTRRMSRQQQVLAEIHQHHPESPKRASCR